MKVFLLLWQWWGKAYRPDNHTPAFILEVPSLDACQAIGAAIVEMAPGSRFRCIQDGKP